MKTTSLVGISFDGTTFTQIGYKSWTPNNQMLAVSNHKPSIVLSTDESKVFTFTSGKAKNTIVA